jgi:DNA invertase Pin-like site-specific DNA recombinase
MVLTVLAGIASFERALIKQRTPSSRRDRQALNAYGDFLSLSAVPAVSTAAVAA